MIAHAGTVGAFLLAWCGVPQLVEAWRTGRCGVAWGTLVAWLAGEVLVFVYVAASSADWRLLVNYGANAVIVSALMRFKARGTQMLPDASHQQEQAPS